MNLKALMFFRAASGRPAPVPVAFEHLLSSYTNGKGSGADRRIALELPNTPYYVGCFSTAEANHPIENKTGDGNRYFPILLNGIRKLVFDVPDYLKVTVFFVDTSRETVYHYAAWVDGDANAYDADVPDGPRTVDVPEGADAFTFSVYYRSHELTEEIMGLVSVSGML